MMTLADYCFRVPHLRAYVGDLVYATLGCAHVSWLVIHWTQRTLLGLLFPTQSTVPLNVLEVRRQVEVIHPLHRVTSWVGVLYEWQVCPKTHDVYLGSLQTTSKSLTKSGENASAVSVTTVGLAPQ